MLTKQGIKRAFHAIGLGSAVEAYSRTQGFLRKSSYMSVRDAQDGRNLVLLMRFLLRHDSNCVDVGANVGSVLREMVRIAPDGRHIAFEPLPERAAQLRTEFQIADVRQLALSNQRGVSNFTRVPDCDAYSGFRRQWYPKKWRTETIEVETDTLDRCLPDGFQPTLIKIDVEGAERDVIAGAIETLRSARPFVVFEHFAGGAGDGYGYGPADMHSLLVSDAAMEIFDIDGTGPYSVQQMEEVFASRRIWTWVARPT